MAKIDFLTITNIIYDLTKSEGVEEVKKIFNFIFENYGEELKKEKIYEFSNHKQSTGYIDYKKYENLLSKEKLKEHYKLPRLERILLNITKEQKAQIVYYIEKLEKQILLFIVF